MNSKPRYKFYIETLSVILVYSLSLVGLHLVITEIFKFTNQDSLIILIPVFLISFPSITYGYQIGIKRYYKFSKTERTKRTFLEVLNSYAIFSLITLLSFIGLYLILIKKSYTFGVAVSLLAAVISIPASKKLYDSLVGEHGIKP